MLRRFKMKPKFKIITIEGKRNPRDPKLCMYFLYSPEGNFLLKGQNSYSIERYIRRHFPVYIYRYTFWKKGKSRGHWVGRHPKVVIRIEEENRRKVVTFHSNTQPKCSWSTTFKRMPNKWIPEYDKVIKAIS
jgi:hypothetical protein